MFGIEFSALQVFDAIEYRMSQLEYTAHLLTDSPPLCFSLPLNKQRIDFDAFVREMFRLAQNGRMHSPLPVALPPLQSVLSLSLCISSIPSTLLCLFLLSTALLLPLSPVHSAMISPTHCNATSICPACCAVLHSLESCLEDDYHEKFMIKVNGDGVLGAMVSL